MSLFISWAQKESLSHDGALLLHTWLPEVLPNLETFVSSEDIASGTLWLHKLFEQLENSESGILCLTKETVDRNWMLFEAGALAKRAGTETSRVCPLLFEFKTLNFPLAAFQAHFLEQVDEARSKKEMLLLAKTLNKNRLPAVCLEDAQLERQFSRCWSEFWTPYTELCSRHASSASPVTAPTITNEDILGEMRSGFRQFADALTEVRRGAALTRTEPSSELQQITVACPKCNAANEVLIPDKPGETRPTICNSCGSRFNVHITGGHSAVVRPVSTLQASGPPQATVSEAVKCPGCETELRVELPNSPGETRSLVCHGCEHIVYVHRRTDGGVLVRLIDQQSTIADDDTWLGFLRNTDAWVEPSVLPQLISLTAEASANNSASNQLTPALLCKELFSQIEAAPQRRISRSVARVFVKLVLVGGGFQFPESAESPTWRSLFLNKLTAGDLTQAYANGVVRRLRTKFSLNLNDLAELAKLLFPEEMPEAIRALRQALEKNS